MTHYRAHPQLAWVHDEQTGDIYALRLGAGHRPLVFAGVAATLLDDALAGLDPVAQAQTHWPDSPEVIEQSRAFLDQVVSRGVLVIDTQPQPRQVTSPGEPRQVSSPEPRQVSSPATSSDERSPGPARVSSATRVLFVCTANICRSAYAEHAARAAGLSTVEFASAGTYALVGHPMDPPMIAALDDHHTQATSQHHHRAQQLSAELISWADIVLTMSARQRHYILDEWPTAAERTFVIGQAARELAQLPAGTPIADLTARLWSRRASVAGDEVSDPYRRGPAAAHACACRLDELVATLIDHLR